MQDPQTPPLAEELRAGDHSSERKRDFPLIGGGGEYWKDAHALVDDPTHGDHNLILLRTFFKKRTLEEYLEVISGIQLEERHGCRYLFLISIIFLLF